MGRLLSKAAGGLGWVSAAARFLFRFWTQRKMKMHEIMDKVPQTPTAMPAIAPTPIPLCATGDGVPVGNELFAGIGLLFDIVDEVEAWDEEEVEAGVEAEADVTVRVEVVDEVEARDEEVEAEAEAEAIDPVNA